MKIALILAAYAAVLAVAGPRVMTRAAWTTRAPRLAIAAWQALCAAVVASVLLAGLALAVPTIRISGSLATLLKACGVALQTQYATPGGAAVSATGAVLALAVATRMAWRLGGSVISARTERTRHRRALALVGVAHGDTGVSVVPDDRPAAYCLPGRGHRIVLTSAALAKLGPGELAAVIAHERAHVRGRHHLALAFADALAAAFPRITLFATAESETRRLVELAADDAACASTDELTLAEALLSMAGAGAPVAPVAALAAGGDVGDRIRRLIDGRRPLPRWGSRLGLVAALALIVVPFVLAAEPAVAVASMNYCPLNAHTCPMLGHSGSS
ncbi:M56 family metallopeptidase [Catenulispora rubra]|uniref:M56 family metallopeptidase n=1 Tax=Catenulispora rubra TaxID=280293 RepID=UPI0018920A32|nr:M56 family metallopeptidase [Catenulispora rubra]